MNYKENLTLKIFNTVMFLGTIFTNFFVIDGVGSLKPIGNISNEYNTLLTPPDWAFSIWGLIYSGLLIFNICQFFPQLGLNQEVTNIGPIFIISCLFNIAWIFTFSLGTKYSILISVFIILGLLISLFFIQDKVKFFDSNSSTYKILFVDIPFSIYLGWVITASIVNIGTSIRAFYVNIDYSNIFYILMLILALIIYIFILVKRNNYGSYVVFIYVLISLIVKHKNNNLLMSFTIVLLIFAIIFLGLKIFLPICKRRINLLR